jgi:hypothetical protein
VIAALGGRELRIELDRPEAVYRPGETIRGRIIVRTTRDWRCPELRLRCEWRTRGRGNPQSGEHTTVDLGGVDWHAGKEQEHRFELAAPSGPLTYHGQLLAVSWLLTARAGVPSAFDPEAQREFELRPWTADDLVAATGGYRDGGPRDTEAYTFGPLCVGAGGVSPEPPRSGDRLVGMGVLGVGVVGLLCSGWLGLTTFALGGLVSSVGIHLLLVQRSQAAVYRTLGRVRATVTPREAPPGDPVEVRVELSPPSALTLWSASAELIGKEVVSNGIGASMALHEHQLAHQVTELAPGNTELGAGPRVLTAVLVIPAGAPVTFTSPHNEVRWTVRARVACANIPAWHADLPLTVRPPSARALIRPRSE